jgi:hypothetical protein
MGALLPLALGILPELAKWIAGDTAGTVAAQAAEIVRTVTGTDDPALAQAALADPAKAAEVRVRLAEIAAQREAAAEQAKLESLRAALADVASARAMASSTPLIARTQVALAGVIMVMFFVVLILMALRGVPQGTETLFNVLLGALIAAQTAVISFFFGNSTSGHSANNAIAQLAERTAAAPSPVSVQSAGTVNAAAPQPSPSGTTADALNGGELARIRSQGA